MFFECLAAGLGDGEGGVGLPSDEAFLALYVAELFEGARVAGQISVGEGEERLEGGEVDTLVDHQHRHDAETGFALESFVYAVEGGNHDLLIVSRETNIIVSADTGFNTTGGSPVFEGEENAEDDMPQSKSEEPEEDAVIDKKAVGDAEDEFSVAEQSDGGGGVVGAVDEGEAVEDKHESGGEAVVTLQEHCQAEQTTCDSGNEEVE